MIRTMMEKDLEQVCALEEQIFSDAWTKQSFQESLNNHDCCLLVSVSEQDMIQGYCCLYHAMDEGEIVNVAVHPEKRQNGIGYELVKALIEKGKKEGVSQFYLEVRESNLSAQRLYEKLGFLVSGVRKNFYQKPTENALIMNMQASLS